MWEKQIKMRELEIDIRRLKFQRGRILGAIRRNYKQYWILGHDSDFYLVLVRRLYRQIEKDSKTDSKVANLKGKYQSLFAKIKIRDSFEHDEDLNLKDSPIKVSRSLIILKQDNKLSVKIQSGIHQWDLESDHNLFIQAVKEHASLTDESDRIHSDEYESKK